MANRFLPVGFTIPNFNINPMEYARAGQNWLANQWADIATQAELQAQRIGSNMRQQKANARAIAEAIKAEAQDKVAKSKSAIKGYGTKTISKTNKLAQEGLDAVFGKQGPSIIKGVGTAPGVSSQGSFAPSPTNIFSSPITKSSIGRIAKQALPIVGTAGRIFGPIADVVATGRGILSGDYDRAQTVGHLGGSALNIGGMAVGNLPLALAGLGLHGITGLNKSYREGLSNLSPSKLARGEYAPTGGIGKRNMYGGQLTTGLLKEPEYARTLEEGGLEALYNLLYPDLLNNTNQVTPEEDISQYFLSNGGGVPITSLPPITDVMKQSKGAGFHVDKRKDSSEQTIPKTNLTAVNEAPASSEEDIINFISRLRSNPAYQQENGLWDNILGYGASDAVRALDTTPSTPQQETTQDPIFEAIKDQLSNINNQLVDASKYRRDPVRDAWIANYFGYSPIQIFGYPQSETDRLVDIQKSLANQLTIYDKLTSAVQDKEQREELRDALSKTGIDEMGLALLMGDKTAGPYVTNVLSKYLTQDLEEDKFIKELQKIALTQNLVGENQMNVARQYGINNLLNTEASGVNARDLAIINKYLDFERTQAIQDRIDRRQDANTAFDLMLYNKGYKGKGTTTEMTPYQQAQVLSNLYELTQDDAYLEAMQSILPNIGGTTSGVSDSKVGTLSNLYR